MTRGVRAPNYRYATTSSSGWGSRGESDVAGPRPRLYPWGGPTLEFADAGYYIRLGRGEKGDRRLFP